MATREVTTPGRPRPDECFQRVLDGEAVGDRDDELVHRHAAAGGFGLEAGFGLGGSSVTVTKPIVRGIRHPDGKVTQLFPGIFRRLFDAVGTLSLAGFGLGGSIER